MSSLVSIKIAVSPASSASSILANKREISSSVEIYYPKRTSNFTTPSKRPPSIFQGAQLATRPFDAPRQLFPYSIAVVAHEYTNDHPPQGEEEDDKTPTCKTRHAPFRPSRSEYQHLHGRCPFSPLRSVPWNHERHQGSLSVSSILPS
ncbi:hypothetical protein F4804DRAFT_322670 [Jackrogersella minutella]|nr:hypothetical protein F4804DRAFT_322670 [Jackrogersella minutella]